MKHAIREVVKLSCVLNVVKVASDIQCEARDSATAQATPDMPESTLKRKREAVSPDNVRMLCSRIDTMRLSPFLTLTHDTEVVSKVCRSLASFSFRKESLEDGRSLSQDVVQGDRSLSHVLGQGGRSLSQGEIQDVSPLSQDCSKNDPPLFQGPSFDTTSTDESSSSSSSTTAKEAWAGHRVMLPKKKLSKPLRRSKPRAISKPPPSKKNQLLLDGFLSYAADLDMGLSCQTNSPLEVKALKKD